jgi:hypothetical protein
MPDPSSQPTDLALQAQLAVRRLSRIFREPTLPWLRRASQAIRVAVLVVLLLMVVVGWGTFSIWVAYGGVVYLVLVTIAVPLWIAYMFRWRPRR